MQLRISTAAFTTASNIVSIVGVSAGADEVEVGSLIKRDGESAIYVIESRTPASGSTLTQVTLTVNYGGVSGTGLCQIVNNFSPSQWYPLTYKGDGDPADWIRRALTMVDVDVASLIAAYPLTPGAAGKVAYSNGTNLAWTALGTAGQSLLSGASGAPTWGTPPLAQIALALAHATGYVDVSGAAAPSAGQSLVASGAGFAAWGTPALASAANALNSATTTIDVAASTAPTAGQVLTATDGTHATWAAPSGGTLANDAYLTGKNSGGVDKRLIGVSLANALWLDRDGLGISAGLTPVAIVNAAGTLIASALDNTAWAQPGVIGGTTPNSIHVSNLYTPLGTGQVHYTDGSGILVGSSNLRYDATGLAIGWAGAGAYLLDVNGKTRVDRLLIGTAGAPAINGSLSYVSSGQFAIQSAFGIQLKANSYSSADANPANVGAADDYHVIIPAQVAAKIGLGIRGAAAQSGALLRAEDSAGTALLDITAAGAVKFYGATSGYVQFAAPAVAGAQSYTLPGADGTVGQVLQTSGAGVLSWATPASGGSGTVNNGTAGYLAYYATTGTAVSELATPAAGQMLVSGAAPAWSASPSLTTSLTVPTIYGGSGVGGALVIQGTSSASDATQKVSICPTYGHVGIFAAADATTPLYVSKNSATLWLAVFSNTNAGGAGSAAGGGVRIATSASQSSSSAFDVNGYFNIQTNGRIRIAIGSGYAGVSSWEWLNIASQCYFGSLNAAGTAVKKLIGFNASDKVSLDLSGSGIVAGSSSIALTSAAGKLLATAIDSATAWAAPCAIGTTTPAAGTFTVALGTTSSGVSGANGQKCEIKTLTELHTLAAATTSDTTINIPVDAQVLAVDVRVTTSITGPANWDYGVAGATTRYGATLALASGTTSKGTQDGHRYYSGATAIRISASDGVTAFTAGVIRVTVYYIEITPATS